MNDHHALPIMLVPRLDEQHLRAVLLVVQVIHDSYLGRAALLGGEVQREARADAVPRDAGVAAGAADVGVLALWRGLGLVRGVVDVWCCGGAAEGPGWVGGGGVEGLGEEEDAVEGGV